MTKWFLPRICYVSCSPEKASLFCEKDKFIFLFCLKDIVSFSDKTAAVFFHNLYKKPFLQILKLSGSFASHPLSPNVFIIYN